MGISITQLGPDAQRQVREKLARKHAAVSIQEQRPKFGNKKTQYRSVQGFTRVYDSMLEARVAERNDFGISAGLIKHWLPQVPILLPGGVRLVVDFLVFWADGRASWIDAKGKETQASKNKRKQARECFGIEIEIVTR